MTSADESLRAVLMGSRPDAKRRALAKAITLLDLRRSAPAIFREVNRGKKIVLPYRGKPVIQLAPLAAKAPPPHGLDDDPFYTLTAIAARNGASLTNEAIDKLVYGS